MVRKAPTKSEITARNRKGSTVRPWPQIENQTDIRGDDLRRLVNGALANLGKLFVYRLDQVLFKYSSDHRAAGWAYIEDGRIEVLVPQDFQGKPWECKEIGQILSHELDHMAGSDHESMLPWWDLPVSWAVGRKLRLKKSSQKS